MTALESQNRKAKKSRIIFALVTFVAGIAVGIGAYFFGRSRGEEKYQHISGFAWSEKEWAKRTKGLRTSFNPDHDLNTETLTLVPGDERWLDFVFWCFNNKASEHQVEAYGGTEWNGPQGGVIFHWAPGSRWETDTLASFGFTIGHIIGEHKWRDTQFPEFFEKYGGVYGASVKDRLVEIDPGSAAPWVEFLEYSGGPNSPYYRYLFHQEALIDPVRERIYLVGGQGAGFEYTFERYYHEVREVLTDARAYQFFQLYDLYGPGFASIGSWARNKMSAALQGIYFTDDMSKWSTKPGVAKTIKYNPNPPLPPIPEGVPEPDAVRRGQEIYGKQCVPCHGVVGDGKGFLAAGFDVQPRDFRQGAYKFRSTKTGEFPTVEDIERIIRVGVANTTMPAWGQFLTDQQIHDVARYIITFSEEFTEAWKEAEKPEMLPVSTVPSTLPTFVARGKDLYQLAKCWECHGERGRGDGPKAEQLQDDWKNPIEATDLTYKWLFKSGHAPADIYRTIFGGLNGTPMPSYLDTFENGEDRWALVAYILSLSPEGRSVLHLAQFKEKFSSVIDENGLVRK